MAVEELFFFKNAKTIITVGQARGVILFVGKNIGKKQGLDIYEYTPLQVKQAVVGYGRADKKQVQQMVKAILGLKSTPKPDDAADALAVAICCASSSKFESRIKNYE
jgi:crossover junction endodeoxyribonuclease RuvC